MVEFACVPIGRYFEAEGARYKRTGLNTASDGWREDWFGLGEIVRLL